MGDESRNISDRMEPGEREPVWKSAGGSVWLSTGQAEVMGSWWASVLVEGLLFCSQWKGRT